jgi:hypothetical protein
MSRTFARSVSDRAHGSPPRPVSGRGQGRQPPKAVARCASLEPGRSLVYFATVALITEGGMFPAKLARMRGEIAKVCFVVIAR